MAVSHGTEVDETNTGTSGTLTPSAGFSTSSDSQVIEDLDITGTITVLHDDVTIRNCKITSSGIRGIDCSNGTTGTIIEDCELIGTGTDSRIGIFGSEFTVSRCNISEYRTQIKFVNSNVVIEESYLHDNHHNDGSHQTCVSTDGPASAIIIRKNHMDSGTDPGNSAALSIYGSNGQPDDILVEDNFFNNNGSYCTYGGSVSTKEFQGTNITYQRNAFGRKYNEFCGISGPVASFNPNGEGNLWVDNYWEDDDTTVRPDWEPTEGGQEINELSKQVRGGTGAASITLSSANATEGSGLIAIINIRGTESITEAPEGWTLLAQEVFTTSSNGVPNTYIYWKIAGASEGDNTWTCATTSYPAGAIIECLGADAENFIQDYEVTNSANSGSTTFDVPSIDVTESGTFVLAMVGCTADLFTNQLTPPDDYTEASDTGGDGSTSGRRSATGVAYRQYNTTGATGTHTYTMPDKSVNWNAFQVAITATGLALADQGGIGALGRLNAMAGTEGLDELGALQKLVVDAGGPDAKWGKNKCLNFLAGTETGVADEVGAANEWAGTVGLGYDEAIRRVNP